jgi:hypothetical protein
MGTEAITAGGSLSATTSLNQMLGISPNTGQGASLLRGLDKVKLEAQKPDPAVKVEKNSTFATQGANGQAPGLPFNETITVPVGQVSAKYTRTQRPPPNSPSQNVRVTAPLLKTGGLEANGVVGTNGNNSGVYGANASLQLNDGLKLGAEASVTAPGDGKTRNAQTAGFSATQKVGKDTEVKASVAFNEASNPAESNTTYGVSITGPGPLGKTTAGVSVAVPTAGGATSTVFNLGTVAGDVNAGLRYTNKSDGSLNTIEGRVGLNF